MSRPSAPPPPPSAETVTAQTATLPFSPVTVMFVVPSVTAVTLPFSSTVATAVLPLVNVTLESVG